MVVVKSKIVFLIRIILGAIFLWSALGKIYNQQAFATNVLDYQIVRHSTAVVIAYVLPCLELIVGLALLSGIACGGAMLLAALMMSVFTGLHGWVLWQGYDISCGCFGDISSNQINLISLLRNAVLMVLVLWGYYTLVIWRPRSG